MLKKHPQNIPYYDCTEVDYVFLSTIISMRIVTVLKEQVKDLFTRGGEGEEEGPTTFSVNKPTGNRPENLYHMS